MNSPPASPSPASNGPPSPGGANGAPRALGAWAAGPPRINEAAQAGGAGANAQPRVINIPVPVRNGQGAIGNGVGIDGTYQEQQFNQRHQTTNVRPNEPISYAGPIGRSETRRLQNRDRQDLVGNNPGEYIAITTTNVRHQPNGNNNQHGQPVFAHSVLTGSTRIENGEELFGAVHYNTHARPDPFRPGRYTLNDGSSVYTHHTNRAVGAPRNVGPAQGEIPDPLENLYSPRARNGQQLVPTFPVPKRRFVTNQVVAANNFNK